MSSSWLEFIRLVSCTGVESVDHIKSTHYNVWHRLSGFENNGDLIEIIARLTPERAVAADMFAVDIHTLKHIMDFDFLFVDHLEVLFRLDREMRNLPSLALISRLNTEQIFVGKVFNFRTLDSIISLSDLSIDEEHIEAFSSLARDARTPRMMSYILSLDSDYVEVFISLPESERSRDILFEVASLEEEMIKYFNRLPLNDRTCENLGLVKKLKQRRGEVFDVLPYYERDHYSLKMIVEFDDRRVDAFLSLPSYERDVVSLDLIQDLSDDLIDIFCSIEEVDQDKAVLGKISQLTVEQVKIWQALAEYNHGLEALESISRLRNDDAALCQKISREVVALSTIEEVLSLSARRRDVFDALIEDDQTREAFIVIQEMHNNRLDVCWEIDIDRLDFLKEISAVSADEFRIFSWLDEGDRSYNTLKMINSFKTTKVLACLVIGRGGNFNGEVLYQVSSMTLRRINVFLSLPSAEQTLAALNVIDSVMTVQFNLFSAVNKCPKNALEDLKLLRALTKSQASASLTLGFRHVAKIKKISTFTGTADEIIAKWRNPVANDMEAPKEAPNMHRDSLTQLVQEVALTTIIRRDIVPKLNDLAVSYNISTNYSDALYKVTPFISKHVASKMLTPACMMAGYHLLHNGVPDNLYDAFKLGGKVSISYVVPKLLQHYQISVTWPVAILYLGGMFFMSHDDDSKTTTDVLYDVVYYNIDPIAIGVLSASISSFVGIAITPALAIAGVAALVTDYGWSAYDKQDLLTFPSSMEMLKSAIVGVAASYYSEDVSQ